MFCEVSPAAGRRARADAPGLGHDRHRAHRDRGQGAGHRADARRCGSAAGTIHQIGLPYHWGYERPGHRRRGQRPARHRRSTRTCTSRRPRSPPATSGPGGGRAGRPAELVAEYRRRAGITGRPAPDHRHDATARSAGRPDHGDQLSGPQPTRPATPATPTPPAAHGVLHRHAVCIGCKACEVACKEWNAVPEDGLDLLGHVLRQHRRARRRHLAARRVHRAATAPDPTGRPRSDAAASACPARPPGGDRADRASSAG